MATAFRFNKANSLASSGGRSTNTVALTDGRTQPPSETGSEDPVSLWRFYDAVSALEYRDPEGAQQLFDDLLTEGLDNYTAPPDLWHNTSMVAARVRQREAELALIQRGQEEWPDNVDLLCDELQLRHTTHYNLKRAEEIWTKLRNMPPQHTAPFWRFWVYGAIYHALVLYDRSTALDLMESGLRSVTRDTVGDILRAYRRVLVDGVPGETLHNDEEVRKHQHEDLDLLMGKLQLGIDLGVENAYTLAIDLARLYQERAESSKDTTSTSPMDRDSSLTKAMEYLNLAERLYTGSHNHPVWEIYIGKIRILMAQNRYGDALKLLKSLPPLAVRGDPSIATMRKLAAQMTGEPEEDQAEDQSVTTEEAIRIALPELLKDEGELLFRLAESNPPIKAILVQISRRLGAP